MKVLRVSVLLSAFAVAASFAQETNSLPTKITIDGVTYEDVRWGTVTPATVTIRHKIGVATIPLEKFPTDLQRRFGYSPDKAAEYRKALADSEQRRIEQQTEMNREREERQKRSDREWAERKRQEDEQRRQAEGAAKQQRATEEKLRVAPVLVRVRQIAEDGILCDLSWPSRWKWQTVFVEDDNFHDEKIYKRQPKWVYETKYVLLARHPLQNKIVDGDVLTVKAYQNGIYRYASVLGAKKTVEQWVYFSEITEKETQEWEAAHLPPPEYVRRRGGTSLP